MHIPDGFLDAKTWITTTALGGASVWYASIRAKAGLQHSAIPRLGLIGAFIFATQMVNFPVAGATSGHFLGGALAAVLFGPWAGVMLMAAVLIIQAFFFQDGGITVLGANILCSGVIGCFTGWAVYRLTGKLPVLSSRQMIRGFLAGWISLVTASAGVAVLLAVSGTVPLTVSLPAMSGWHSLIGIGEGLITAWVLAYWTRVNGPLQEKAERFPVSGGMIRTVPAISASERTDQR